MSDKPSTPPPGSPPPVPTNQGPTDDAPVNVSPDQPMFPKPPMDSVTAGRDFDEPARRRPPR